MPDVKGLWQMVVVLLVLVVVVVPDRIGKVRGVGRVAVIVGELCCVVDIVGVGRYCYFGMVGVSNNEGVFEDFVAENMSATGSVDRNFVGGEGLTVGVGMKVGNMNSDAGAVDFGKNVVDMNFVVGVVDFGKPVEVSSGHTH